MLEVISGPLTREVSRIDDNDDETFKKSVHDLMRNWSRTRSQHEMASWASMIKKYQQNRRKNDESLRISLLDSFERGGNWAITK